MAENQDEDGGRVRIPFWLLVIWDIWLEPDNKFPRPAYPFFRKALRQESPGSGEERESLDNLSPITFKVIRPMHGMIDGLGS